jgi:dTDP-4-dehydrorhamnose 3,5-epimerase
MPFDIQPCALPGVCTLKPQVFSDARGQFAETWQLEDFKTAGINDVFVQDNHSRTVGGVLRGLHFQISRPQAQLVNVIHGEVFDVVVDLRRGSPTYAQSCSFSLTDKDPVLLYMPPGCAHGFYAVSERVDIYYKVSSLYDREDEGGLAWNDPDLKINWPDQSPLTSERDGAYPNLRDIVMDNRPQVDFTP